MENLKIDDPRRIGPYIIKKRLGEGGMGSVYLGADAGGRLVAVKVIIDKFANDPEHRARFRREIKAARKVKKEFTAPVLDDGTDRGKLWYATEYIAGPTLDEAVRLSRFSGEGLVSIAYSLCRALVGIHGANIVHRDFKPKNIILSPDGVKVIDYGVAFDDEEPKLTMSGSPIGTPLYMSPEQIDGKRPQPSWDIFAYGCLLVFAATGRPPFSGATPMAVWKAILNSPPQLDGVPSTFLPIVKRCLEKDPARRITLSELLRLLPKPKTSDVHSTSWMPPSVSGVVRASTRLAGSLQSPKPLDPTKLDRRPASPVGGDVPKFTRRPGALPAKVVAQARGDANKPASPRPVATNRGKHAPPASRTKERTVGAGWWVAALLVATGLVTGAVVSRGDNKKQPPPAPISLDLETPRFSRATLPSKGNPKIERIEVVDRTVRIRVIFKGDAAAWASLRKDSCLKVAYGQKATLNVRPDDRDVPSEENILQYSDVLSLPGKVAFMSTCKRDAPVTAGVLIGTNKIRYGGVMVDKNNKATIVVRSYVENKALKAVVPYYTNSAYDKMCLKTPQGMQHPAYIVVGETKDRAYRVLSFRATSGTLYMSCSGSGKKAKYVGKGATLP